jgi:hypothetical protein
VALSQIVVPDKGRLQLCNGLTAKGLLAGEVSEPVRKKLRTVNMATEGEREEEEEEEEEEGAGQQDSSNMYQHIKEAKNRFDTQALDAATKVSC